uniref:Uncharacterized protein n=1 Tax=Colobus angolensis palliatus TaxID=336983 RepID=A0A2K5JU22_COLAP
MLSSQKTGGNLDRHTTPKPIALLQPEPGRQRGADCCLQILVCFPTDLPLARKVTKLSWLHWPAYREELELEPLLWRRRPGERDLRCTGDLRLGERDLLLVRGGDLRHVGGGGNILLGGLNLLGGGLGQGASTAVAVISCALSASSGFSNSKYA